MRTRIEVQNGSRTRIISRFDLRIGSVASRCAMGKPSRKVVAVMTSDSQKVRMNSLR
ncbi:hypothetical protein D3C76_1691080 [compost metagenome]